MSDTKLETIVNFSKRKGFVFQSSEIYGGFAATYDFGPLGVLLKKNIEHVWRHWNVTSRTDMVEIEGAIFMHPKAWEASGHIGGFSDLLVEDLKTHKRYRADHLVEDARVVWPISESKNSPQEGWTAKQGGVFSSTSLTKKEIDAIEKDLKDQGFELAIDCFITNKNDQVFTQRRSQNRRLYPGGWDLPGGHVDKDDSVYNTIFKEVKEELNLEVDQIISLVDKVPWTVPAEKLRPGENGNKIILQFEVTVKTLDGLKLEEGKADKYEWISLENLEVLKVDNNLYTYDSVKNFLVKDLKYNFIFLHGYEDNSTKHFWPNLKQELQSRGYQVSAPNLPNSSNPVEQEQLDFVLNNYKINQKTIIIGHSLGAALALKIAEKISNIRGSLLIDPFIKPEFNGYEVNFKDSFSWDFDWENIKNNVNKIVILADKTEKPVPVKNSEIIAEKLGAELFVKIPNEDHFCSINEPEIMKALENLLKQPQIQEYSPKYQDQTIKIMQEGWIDSSTVNLDQEIILENCKRTSEKSLDDNGYKKFIILENDTVIGYLSLQIELNNEAFISDFYIKKEFRKKGVGSQLFSYGLNYLKESGIHQVDLYLDDSNITAAKFYNKFGFTQFKASKFEWLNNTGEVVATNPEHLMRLELGGTTMSANSQNDDQVAAATEGNIVTNAGAFSAQEIDQIIEYYNIKSPDGNPLSKAKSFNLLVQTHLGPIEDETTVAYLKGESCANIYLDWKAVQETTRRKLPFGIAQIGKAFRNEITVKQFMFRTREFEQMDVEFFVKPGTEDKFYAEWKQNRWDFYTKTLNFNEANLRYRQHDKDELVFYAKEAWDVEYSFGEIGFKELEGIHNRTDYDTTQHSKFSGQDLTYFDPDTNTRYNPYIVELSAGFNRMYLAILFEFYTEEEIVKASNGDQVDAATEVAKETRIVMKFPYDLAPYKLAILPLMKKDGLGELAFELYSKLRKLGISTDYDESGSIGKRYRRQDENGTPFCVTIDYDTKEKGLVTIRNRDTMAQETIKIDEIEEYLSKNK